MSALAPRPFGKGSKNDYGKALEKSGEEAETETASEEAKTENLSRKETASVSEEESEEIEGSLRGK